MLSYSRPQKWLKPYYLCRSPYFLYPDETTVKGSTVACSALLRACLDQQRVGLARFVRTASSAPQLVALVPQAEETGEGGAQVSSRMGGGRGWRRASSCAHKHKHVCVCRRGRGWWGGVASQLF